MKKMQLKFVMSIIVAMLAFTGCGENEEPATKNNHKNTGENKQVTAKIDIDELQENTGIMLEVSKSMCGQVDGGLDYWKGRDYILYYNGTLEIISHYNHSGDFRAEVNVNDEDYLKLYCFAVETYENDTFSELNIDACDGDKWSFLYYEAEGESHKLYSGYTYGEDTLENIQSILDSYRDGLTYVNSEGLTYDEANAALADINEYWIENYECEERENYCFDNMALIMDYISEVDSSKNIIYSETSLNMALGLLLEGAGGDTENIIMNYLAGSGYTSDATAIRNRNNALINIYNSNESVTLNVANSIWSDEGIEIYDDYAEQLLAYYDAKSEVLDFMDVDSASIVNEWCSLKTNGKIDEIVSPDVMESSRMLLINALYFDGDWAVPFEDYNVVTEDFTNADGSVSSVSMMHDYDISTYFENEYATGFAKYYEGYNIAFIGILPKSEGDYLISDLDLKSFMESRTTNYDVYIKMPKFKVEDNNSLTEALKSLGMEDLFADGACDFSNISSTDLHVSDVIQKTYVDVNETGTEAAAVTVGVMTDGCDMEINEIKEVYLDRPFMFMIYDMENKECLFTGKINNL